MEKEKMFKYFRRMLSEIKNEEKISIGRNVPKTDVNYIKLENYDIPCCILQKTNSPKILLGNKFADVEISEDEFNALVKESLDRLIEIKKMQIDVMEEFAGGLKQKRLIYSFNELCDLIPNLKKYGDDKISNNLSLIISMVDEFTYAKNMKLFQILTPASDNVVFVFDLKQ